MLTPMVPGLSQVVQDTTRQLTPPRRALASNVVVPQTGAFAAWRQPAQVQLVSVEAVVAILTRVATTTLDIRVRNPTHRRQEAEIVLPVPANATVRGLDFLGSASEPTAELLRRDEARSIYDGLVNRVRDPALLEFIGYNLIRSSVFPVEPGAEQRIVLTYEEILPADGDRVDYVLPRSEALDSRVPWKIITSIASQQPVSISTVYSPSHRIETTRTGENLLMVRLAEANASPGAFRLSYLTPGRDVTASFLSYPDPKIGGGYFLLFAGLPSKPEAKATIRREVLLVIDRSGSMNGEKLQQVREAALQVIAGLDEGEAFNIILYNEAVERFAPKAVTKSAATVKDARAFLEKMQACGGTNIHDALLEALRMEPAGETLPMVLFLTDGLPTIGQTSEVAIRELASKANPYKRRVFTFGVGLDVNTALLENVAFATRATTTFVLPQEDVEVKVAQVFKRLSGPVLADPQLAISNADRQPAPDRVRELFPAELPDLFLGDQLVLLGRYRGEEPILFHLSGNYLGTTRRFEFSFSPQKATTQNAFVPRLWASRKIGMLVDAIRKLGADLGVQPDHVLTSVEPRLKELVDEVVALSKEFGVLTEYTAFLAREGTDLADIGRVFSEARSNFVLRAFNCRSGVAAANQDYNLQNQKQQAVVNISNGYLDANMNRVAIDTVQQISDRAFYKRGRRWVDSRLVEKSAKPTKVIEFGSPEFFALAHRLASVGRQSCIALKGDILLSVDGQTVLIHGPRC